MSRELFNSVKKPFFRRPGLPHNHTPTTLFANASDNKQSATLHLSNHSKHLWLSGFLNRHERKRIFGNKFPSSYLSNACASINMCLQILRWGYAQLHPRGCPEGGARLWCGVLWSGLNIFNVFVLAVLLLLEVFEADGCSLTTSIMLFGLNCDCEYADNESDMFFSVWIDADRLAIPLLDTITSALCSISFTRE